MMQVKSWSVSLGRAVRAGRERSGQGSGQVYKIGMTFPLTGPIAATTSDLIAAGEVAASHINKAGGINGHRVQIVAEDSLGAPAGGITAMRKLVEVDGVQAIVTMASNVASAQLPLATQLKVPFLTIAQAPNLVNQSDYTFAHAQTIPALGLIYRDWWRKTAAHLLVPNNAVAVPILAAFRAATASSAQPWFIPPSTTATPTTVVWSREGIQSRRDLAVVVRRDLDTTIIKQLREGGVTAPIDMSSNYYDDRRRRRRQFADNSSWRCVAIDPVAGSSSFRFRIRVGNSPSAIAAEACDIVKMFAYAIGRSSQRRGDRKAARPLKGVPSVPAAITVDPDHYSPPRLQLFQVKNGKTVRISTQ